MNTKIFWELSMTSGTFHHVFEFVLSVILLLVAYPHFYNIILYISPTARDNHLLFLYVHEKYAIIIISIFIQAHSDMIHIHILYEPLNLSLFTYTPDAYQHLYLHSFQSNSCNLSTTSLETASSVFDFLFLLCSPSLTDFVMASIEFLELTLSSYTELSFYLFNRTKYHLPF